MYSNSGTLYPMLGVGSFMAMFWTGIVLGYELGLGCASLLILGLLCACVGTVCVCELQRRDGHAAPATRRAPQTAAPAAGAEEAGAGRSVPVTGAGRLGAAGSL